MLYTKIIKGTILVVTLSLLITSVASISISTAWADEGTAIKKVTTRMLDAIVMKAGCDYAYVRGGKQNIDGLGSTPLITNNIAFVPLRFLADSLNSRIEWNETKGSATLYYMEYEYIFVPDSVKMKVVNPNGNQLINTYTMPAAAQMYDNRIYVSLDSFAKDRKFFYEVESSGLIVLSHSNYFEELPEIITYDEIRNVTLNLFKDEFNSNDTEAIFYVDVKKGRDGQLGSYNKPFKTIGRAQQEVRNYIAEKGMNGNIIVYLRGGEYFFDSTMQFDERDSGKNGFKVIYKSFPGEEPIINGGKSIKGWEKYKDNIYRAYVGKNVVFHVLFESGTFSNKARYPNEGYNEAVSYNNVPDKQRFNFEDGDIPNVTNVSRAELVIWPGGDQGLWSWFQDIHEFKEIDFNNKVAIISSPTRYTMGTGSRYYIQGALGLLDTPGEFYLDSNEGYVYYWPKNDIIEEQTIVFPISGNLVDIIGSSEENYAHDISFEGLTFRNVERNKYAFYMTNTARINIDSCRIHNIGGTAVYMYSFAQNNKISNCEIYDIGKDGIVFKGNDKVTTDPEFFKKNVNRYNVAINNHIYNMGVIIGHTYPIYISESSFNRIAYNKVHDSKRYGIAMTGNANDIISYPKLYGGADLLQENKHKFLKTDYNVIEFNDVSECYTDSEDVGAINIYGIDEYNIIRNNAIYNNNVEFSSSYPLYLDDEHYYTTVYNNVIYNNQNDKSKSGKMNAPIYAKGTKTTVFNNICADNAKSVNLEKTFAIATWSYDVKNNRKNYGVLSERNIFFNTSDESYKYIYNSTEGIENDYKTKFRASDYNMFYNDNNYSQFKSSLTIANIDNWKYKTMPFTEWVQWQDRKFDNHTILNKDPLFMNPKEFDYRLSYKSPAFLNGFRDINFKDIGLRASFPFSDANDPLGRLYVSVKDREHNGFISLKSGEKSQIIVAARTKKGFVVDMKKPTVKYFVFNPDIAQITADGAVLAKQNGVTRVDVEVELNGIKKSVPIDVLVSDQSIKDIEFSSAKNLMIVGEKITTRVYSQTSLGQLLDLEKVNYSSSDLSIATIDENGLIQANGVGKAIITASIEKDEIIISNNIEIKVKDTLFSDFDYQLSKHVLSTSKDDNIILSINSKDINNKPYTLGDEIIDVKQSVESNSAAGGGNDAYHTEEQEEFVKIEKKDNKTYLISGIKPGMTSIKVTVNSDEIVKEKEIPIQVLDTSIQKDQAWKITNYTNSTGTGEVYKDGNFSLESTGEDVWGNADDFTFLHKNIKLSKADEKVEITAKFYGAPGAILNNGDVNKSHIGLMIRDKNSNGAKYMAHRVMQSTGGIRVTYRMLDDIQTAFKIGPNIISPYEIKIIKDGNKFNLYYKDDNDWAFVYSGELEMSQDIHVGLLCYSGNKDESGKNINVSAYGSVEILTGDDVRYPEITVKKK